MSDRPPADRTARLLLRYYREPSRFRTEALQPDAPRLDGGVVLKLALGHRIEFAETALNRLSVSVLRDAAASYVRRMHFRADATPYQTLGLAPDAAPEAIKDNFRLLMQLVHPDRQDAQARWPESCAAQANRAHGILKNEESRAKFDREEAERARAAAAQAARSAVVAAPAAGRWSERGYAAGRSPERALLPEWLTGAVGGFVRAHPALVGFSVLIGGAVLVIGATVRDGESGSLTREERLARAPDRAPERALVPTPAPAFAPTSRPTPSLASAPTPTPAPAPTPAPPAAAESVASKPAPVPANVPVAPPPAAAAPERRVPTTSASPPPRVDTAAVTPSAPATVASVASVTAVPPAVVANVAAIAPTATPPAALAATEPTSPTNAEIEALFATFVESYDRGRIDAFAALFDDDAESNLRRGRAAIRGEYDELFRLSSWRKMQLTRINWKRAGERTYAKGEIAVRIGWRDGREVDQRIAVDMEMAHRDGRLVITRLSHQPRTP
jgi:hypothetical protein